MYAADILNRRRNRFVLWLPGRELNNPPRLLLATYVRAKYADFLQLVNIDTFLIESPEHPGLWELDPASISPKIKDGTYRYWYYVDDHMITDPLAFTVEYTRDHNRNSDHPQPGAILNYRGGQLFPCDRNGNESESSAVPEQSSLPANNHLVIYELPTSWARGGTDSSGAQFDIGTFLDVHALFRPESAGANFYPVPAVRTGAVLADLGINALELLPAADAKARDEWGYATANYFAPDYDLGEPSMLHELVRTMQEQGVRLITDVVMAFGHDPYGYVDFAQFHIKADDEPENPDSYQSHADNQKRVDWGGKLWRYLQDTRTYDPESGETRIICPAQAFHRCHLTRWMTDFGVGGLRLDSLNNVGNWDFIRSYHEKAWELYNERYQGNGDPSKFLVIGEELSMPVDMIHKGCVNALWNEPWQKRLRCAILGEPCDDNFEWTVRKIANCTLDNLHPGFTDGAQAVNYITSHDIEGFRKERLYDFLASNNIWDIQRRAQLAFVLLLTSVGIPMIFAGEEFADQMDISRDMQKKQHDPVNYERKDDGGWRQALFEYVSRLVKFRTKCPALVVNGTDFFHVDGSRDGKIMAWRRGPVRQAPVVVVVANFTDQNTPGDEYVVPDWPDKDVTGWREVTQDRDVPQEWLGREPLMAWEAKVYTYWRE